MCIHLGPLLHYPVQTLPCGEQQRKQNQDIYDKQVTDALYQNFYADDCLMSVATEQEAIKLAGDRRSICAEEGFKLTKWMSNNRGVIHSIPENERS